MDIEEEIARVIGKAFDDWQGEESEAAFVTGRLTPLLNRVRAEALRDAADWKRDHNLGNTVWGDYLKQLAEEKYQAGGDDMITIWLEDRADRIEQEGAGA